VSISDACTVDAIQTCVSQLWALHVKDLKVPITWAHAEAARAWLKSHGLFVSVFDHNLSSLGAFCPKLVFEHACKLLDFLHHQSPEANFA
jgi:hypothetical protein